MLYATKVEIPSFSLLYLVCTFVTTAVVHIYDVAESVEGRWKPLWKVGLPHPCLIPVCTTRGTTWEDAGVT